MILDTAFPSYLVGEHKMQASNDNETLIDQYKQQ